MRLLGTVPFLAFAAILVSIVGFCVATANVTLLLVGGVLAALSRNNEPVVCSDCGSPSVDRLFSTFAARTSSTGSPSALACGPSSGIA